MTVKQLRQLLKGLPSDMPVMLDIGDGVLVSVCGENSQVIEVPILEDEDFENDDPINDFHQYDLGEDDEQDYIELLLLVPCSTTCELKEGEVNSQPELN